MPRAPAKRTLARERARLVGRFADLQNEHRREPSAHTWFSLGCVMAQAYDVSRDFAEELRKQMDPQSTATTFDPLTCWEHAVQLAPDHVPAWLRLGKRYAELDEKDKALACLTEAVKQDPKQAEAWAGLGQLAVPPADEASAERLSEAERCFKRAIAADAEKAADCGVYSALAEGALYLALRWYEMGATKDPFGYCAKGARRVARALK
jgi:cytochrome c-type biogenesis protein CcmH/NrfG